VINTIAGNGVAGYSGDGGQATAAELYAPEGLMIDPSGNLYLCDEGNSRVRMVNLSNGIITTWAGNGNASSSGDGGPATAAGINKPYAVLFDNARNYTYITEYSGNKVRVVDFSGTINTLVGTGVSGYGGDGGPATAAKVDHPTGLALDGAGNLYVADALNTVIRKVTGIPNSVNGLLKPAISYTVYPNPAIDNLTVQLSKTGKTVVTLYDITGREVINTIKENTSVFNISVAGMPAGIYLLKLQSEDGSTLTKKIEVTK
jgi:hypothetical protein